MEKDYTKYIGKGMLYGRLYRVKMKLSIGSPMDDEFRCISIKRVQSKKVYDMIICSPGYNADNDLMLYFERQRKRSDIAKKERKEKKALNDKLKHSALQLPERKPTVLNKIWTWLKNLFKKKAPVILLICLLPLLASATSNFERHMLEPGGVVINKHFPIGKDFDLRRNRIEYTAIKSYNPANTILKKAICISIKDDYREYFYIDYAEIQPLINALFKMVNKMVDWKDKEVHRNEMYYLTASSLAIGFYQDGVKQEIFMTRNNHSDSISRFSPEYINTLLNYLKQGMDILNKKGETL